MQLRSYQDRGINDIRDAFRYHRRVLYVAPTGSGKTVMFGKMAMLAATKGTRVCIVVHRRELLLQTADKIGLDHGRIASGERMTGHRLQIATIQTACRRDLSDRFDLIIVDEAHHAPSDSYKKLLDENSNAHVLGVTATPCRLDGRGLGDMFDVLIEGPTVQWLTLMGYLAKAVVYAPAVINVDGIRRVRGDYVTADLDARVNRPTVTGDAIRSYQELGNDGPAIVFCVSVAHARATAAAFSDAGYVAKCVDGETPDHIRDSAIRGLGDGYVRVVTSCEILGEGVDVPDVSVGIMLRPTHSAGLALQQMGRCLRPSTGKTKAVILDHAGNCLRYGLPDTHREWTLDHGHAKAAKDPDDIRIRRCPSCYFVAMWGTSCPQCGKEYPMTPRQVREQEGALAKLAEVKLKKQLRQEVGRAKSYDQLKRIEKERGYKNGWANFVWRSRQHGHTKRNTSSTNR